MQHIQDVLQISGATLLTATMLSSAIAAGGLVGLAISFRNLPDVRSLRNYIPTETSYVYDMEGNLLDSLHDEANREVVDLNEMSPHLKRAVLAVEDSDFYTHSGINPVGIGRAFLANVQAGGTTQGGSTITMQLIKNLFLTPQQAISRKVAEVVLSLRLEQIFEKDEILEMYLNQVYWLAIGGVLATAGLDFTHVFKATVWLTDIQDFAAFNAVYAEVFGDAPPVRSTVCSGLALPGAVIEIEVTAYAPA